MSYLCRDSWTAEFQILNPHTRLYHHSRLIRQLFLAPSAIVAAQVTWGMQPRVKRLRSSYTGLNPQSNTSPELHCEPGGFTLDQMDDRLIRTLFLAPSAIVAAQVTRPPDCAASQECEHRVLDEPASRGKGLQR